MATTQKPIALPSSISISEPSRSSSLSVSDGSVCLVSNDENKDKSIEVIEILSDSSAPEATETSSYVDTAEEDSASNSRKPKETDVIPRRSSRERKSTVMIINGQPVLTKNNYEVKGMTYVHGAFDADQQKPKRKKKRGGKNNGVPKPKRATHYKMSSHDKMRLEHNERIKTKLVEMEKNQMEFMSRNLNVLSDFVPSKVHRQLASHNQQSSDEKTTHKEVYMQPESIQGDMRDYQLYGLNWMTKMHDQGLGMILGDEMGLGKTLQTLSLLCFLKEHRGLKGPSLVICPLTVLYSWCNEIEKWAPSMKYLRFHSSDNQERIEQKHLLVTSFDKYDIIVTTYEMAKSPELRSYWQRQYFNYVVLDEGHIIKQHTSQVTQAVKKLHRLNSLILTGTPLQNNLSELWSILHFLYPKIFTSEEPFSETFDINKNVIDELSMSQAREMLHLFMLRRLKVEVEKLLPKKIETKVVCPLSKMQMHWYKGLLLKDIHILARADNDGDTNNLSQTMKRQLRNLVMQLRKCCNHPFLFAGAENEDDIDDTTCEELIAPSGKLAVLDKLLVGLFRNGNRVVLFSQFTKVLDILEDYADLRGWNYCRFDGSTQRAKRNYIVNQFNAPGSDCFLFLMSTRSGGMGLNLQTADTCILFDSDWNPQADIQAQARVHRIGQKKTVHVYRLVTKGTVEERMIERAEKKLYLDQVVNCGNTATIDTDGIGLSAQELVSALKFGSDAIFGNNCNDLPDDEDIALIIDRKRTDNTSIGKLKGGVTRTVKDFNVHSELTSCGTLNGVDFVAIRDANKRNEYESMHPSVRNIATDWIRIQENTKRQRKSRIVQIAGMGSGYGSAYVPVLSSNNYDLIHGESSVFDRELGHKEKHDSAVRKIWTKQRFENQEFCQVCGDGGKLILCSGCPISFHKKCYRSLQPSERCFHHYCCHCKKKISSAGGILFPCNACPNSYCEDCLPKTGVRYLGTTCPRFEKLGFNYDYHCYVHCTPQCEKIAVMELGWVPPSKQKKVCPEPIDVSYAFGNVDDGGHSVEI